MFFKDVFRLIKSTYKRFFAIAGIVFIGVAFMMGLLSNPDIMRRSVVDYDNKNNLHDIQLYSTFGFDDNDVDTLKKLDIVKDVYPSKTRDVYGKTKDTDPVVFRVRELDSNINNYEIIDGKLPIKDNECLLVDNGTIGELKINDTINLFLKEEDLNESLRNTEYIIVGTVKSPEFMAKLNTSSLLDNIDLSDIVLVPNSNFISEYYTSILLTINDADKYNSLKEEYFSFMEDKVSAIEDLASSQKYVLKNKIIDDATKEIEDAKEELEKGRRDGKKELVDAYNKILDAKKQIDDGEKELIDNERLLEDSTKQLNEGYKELQAKEVELNNAIHEVEQASGMSLNDLLNSTLANLNTYNELLANKQELENNKRQLLDTKAQLESQIRHADDLPEPLTKNALKALMKLIKDKESNRYKKLEQIYEALDFLDSYDSNMNTVESYLSQVNDGLAQIEEGYKASGGINETYNNLVTLSNGTKQVKDGYAQIEANRKKIEDGYVKLEEGKAKLKDAKKEYEEGLFEYEKGVKEFNKKIQDAEDEIEDAENKIKDLDDASWIILDRDSHYSSYMYRNSCDQMDSIGIVLPILFFLVAALVCSTTMKRLIDEQRGQIGIYCALGYSNFSIIARYLAYVLLATLISSFIAIFVGIAIFPTVIYNTWRLMYNLPDMEMYIPIGKMIISILSFALLMSFVSFLVIRKTIKEKPAELMRPKAPTSSKEIALEKIKLVWNRLSFTSKITARNLFRYKSRFFMTVFGIAGCTGLLVLGFGIKDSIRDIVNVQFNDFFNYDYTINLNNDRHLDEINEYLNKDSNTTYHGEFASYSSKITFSNNKDDVISVTCLDDNSFDNLFNLYDYRTNKLLTLEEDDIIITEKFAKNNNLSIGDEITLESKEGTNAKVKITKICKMYFQHYLYISSSTYMKLFNENIEYTNIGVKNQGDTTNLYNLTNEFKDVASINDFSSFIERFNNMIETLDFIILVVIITSGALAFVVLINLINVNISERTREIATLKVLGFRDNEVEAYIFKEIIILSIIGSILGMPLGAIEVKFVMRVIDMEMIKFPTVVKFPSYLYAFAITMLFTFIVFMMTKKTLKKIEMVESLKSVE